MIDEFSINMPEEKPIEDKKKAKKKKEIKSAIEIAKQDDLGGAEKFINPEETIMLPIKEIEHYDLDFDDYLEPKKKIDLDDLDNDKALSLEELGIDESEQTYIHLEDLNNSLAKDISKPKKNKYKKPEPKKEKEISYPNGDTYESFAPELDEGSFQDWMKESSFRFGVNKLNWKKRHRRLPMLRFASWWVLHNVIAHMFLGILPFKPFIWFHDWTSKHLNREPFGADQWWPIAELKASESPIFMSPEHYFLWVIHHSIVHPLIGILPFEFAFKAHDATYNILIQAERI